MMYPTTDLEGHIKTFACGGPTNASAPIAITAAGTGDNTAVTGQTINTLTDRGDSMVFIVHGHASLTATKVLTVAAELQESSDGSTWDTAESLYRATTVVSGTGENYGVKETHVKLKGRKQYIRFNFTPDLDAGATDTAVVLGVAVMAGSKKLPVT